MGNFVKSASEIVAHHLDSIDFGFVKNGCDKIVKENECTSGGGFITKTKLLFTITTVESTRKMIKNEAFK